MATAPQTASAPARADDGRTRAAAALALLRGGELTAVRASAAGFAAVDDVVRTVAEAFRMPHLELDAVELDPALAPLLARDVAERRRLVPVYASELEVSIATSDPTQIEFIDWIGRELRRHITVVVAGPAEIDRAIRRLYDSAVPAQPDGDADGDLSAEAVREAVQIVDAIIAGAMELSASDIHVEASERETVVRYRVDGALRHASSYSSELHAAIVSRMKVLSQLDISVRHAPQDGRIKLATARGTVDLRVSVLPTFWGEKVCCRLLDNRRACLPLEQLGFAPHQRDAFDRLIRAPYGLLLVTGPTGSGKSTTLYSALNAVKSPELNIVTVEDPVEYQLPGINQVQVNAKRGVTFAGALRSILRQDPDVILVGEIRDHETGVIAAEAALTGHLVLASLHTNDAPSSVTRLCELGVANHLIAPSLLGVIAQRLLRRVCDECAETYEPGDAELAALGIGALPAGVTLRRGAGCAACGGTGYRGRLAVHELLEVDDAMRSAIARGATTDEISSHAAAGEFKPMRYAALRRMFAGETTSAEVIRATR